jgi:hypothetical protein
MLSSSNKLIDIIYIEDEDDTRTNPTRRLRKRQPIHKECLPNEFGLFLLGRCVKRLGGDRRGRGDEKLGHQVMLAPATKRKR